VILAGRESKFCSGLTLWISVIGELTEGEALRSVTTLGEFFDHSATSESWHVQWETVPPGEESEPRSLGCMRRGNEADEANRQSHPWDGERVTGPQRK